MTQFAKKLRAILEKAGKLDATSGEALLNESLSEKRPFTEVLVKKGVATEAELLALIEWGASVKQLLLMTLLINSFVPFGLLSTGSAVGAPAMP